MMLSSATIVDIDFITMPNFLISVVGPTAIGKTALSIKLAQFFNSEIISADSRQFYKEMKIGTAAPTEKELAAVDHHFIYHISIVESYTVGDFEKEAITKLNLLFETNNISIMVGGSGLYVDAVVNGLDEFPKIKPQIREQLNTRFEEEGLEPLKIELQKLDPSSFTRIETSNPHRVIRALEVCLSSGKPYSSFLKSKKRKRNFEVLSIGLEADRALIYERINQRVDMMMNQGLLNEARNLYQKRHLNALNTVGYKELFKYFDGSWELDFAISEIKKNTRRFAKRQLTWFKRNKETRWYDFDTDIEKIKMDLEQAILKKNKK
ncbi:MAG: tRNA (adenosine(37)-N6)-dimethylallyltransferase MiaA [Bacteroidota bacterium]